MKDGILRPGGAGGEQDLKEGVVELDSERSIERGMAIQRHGEKQELGRERGSDRHGGANQTE